MKRLIVFIVFFVPITLAAQADLQKIRKSSWQTLVYRISAVEALQFEKWDSIPVSRWSEVSPFDTYDTDSWFEDSLPIGSYVFVSAFAHYLKASLYNQSSLVVLAINNKQSLQLDVRNKLGEVVNASSIVVGEHGAVFNSFSKTFWVKQRNFDEARIVVCSPGDTLITFLEKQDELDYPVSRQKKINYRNTRVYKIISFVPSKFRSKPPSLSIGARGFMVFSQPKYKPLDTVKFKAYVMNKRWKQYSGKIDLFLEYSSKGEFNSQRIAAINPVSPGAYVYSFNIADSIPADITASIVFKNKAGKKILHENFKIEDYVLDEIGTQEFRSEKEIYFSNDSLRFYASAKDANGLFVMDATARLIITADKIHRFYKDTLFVADTLYDKEIKLVTDTETKFVIAPDYLPGADLEVKAKLVFKNANNELQEKVEAISYLYKSKQILVKRVGDSVRALFIENGRERNAIGEMEMNDEDAMRISYPYSVKIDPMADHYTFYYEDTKDTLTKEFQIPGNYSVTLSTLSRADTLGFVLQNPYKVPVYFTVFNGKAIVATGRGEDQFIEWKKLMKDRRQMYKVRWQYYWGGEELSQEENIGLMYKLLNVSIDANQKIYPGQKDSLKLQVTDYKGEAANNVNLTAVSYNSQFKAETQPKDPPYLVKYKSRKFIERDGFDMDDPDELILVKNYLLGNYRNWHKKFGLDSMEYYRLLFPKTGFYDAVRPLSTLIPQLSISVVDKGVPQEVYLLYINRQLRYYNDVTDRMRYSFEVYPENVQIGIRLRDKFIQIDSLYMQPYYKHDISFDVNNLPRNATVNDADTAWSISEKALIEKSMWQMQNDPDNNNGFIWQGSSLVKMNGGNSHVAGPFRSGDSMTFFRPGGFDINFVFEPGYQYRLSSKVLRLELKPLFPARKAPYTLPRKRGNLTLGDTLSNHPEIIYPVDQMFPGLKLARLHYQYYYNYKLASTGRILYTLPADSVVEYILLLPKDSLPIVIMGQRSDIHNVLPGRYQLMLVTKRLGSFLSKEFTVRKAGTICLDLSRLQYKDSSLFLLDLMKKAGDEHYQELREDTVKLKNLVIERRMPDSVLFVSEGGGTVYGEVLDRKGSRPISFGTVIIQGTSAGVVTDTSGQFVISKLRPGSYVLQVSQVGYSPKEIAVKILENTVVDLQILLELNENYLQEVVVTGYGMTSKKNMTGAAVSIRSSLDVMSLSGKAAGVQIVSQSGMPGGDIRIQLRGVFSYPGNNEPIYVVDGIVYLSPPNIDAEMIADISVLKEAAAIQIYGARAANGAIVIITKAKTERKDFRDYAFWAPNFFTDKNGKAAVEVTYPDNVTGWKTYVIAMDKKRRIGKAITFTQAFKPILAQLNLPLFLIEGDSSRFITKSVNYTSESYSVKTIFTFNNAVLSTKEKVLVPNDASIEDELVTLNNVDTLTASFALQTTTGFKDMEQRKIPVYKKGTEEVSGKFWVLQQDTTITFGSKSSMHTLSLYAQNNNLDVMLEELEHLKNYPYYCTEQICSKLTGLVLEKNIKQHLKQPFKNQPLLDNLLKKVQKAQQFDGGWAWWENGQSNLYISNYVLNALLLHRSNPLVEINIRNGFLYLVNRLPYLGRNELLASLTTLSNGKHVMDYAAWIKKIPFDSLGQHQQWQWVKIKQQEQLPFRLALDSLLTKKTATMLGGVHWGADNNLWYSNDVATTIIAFEVLQKLEEYKHLITAITQYFLEKKQFGYWRNTVETAGILNTILPGLLATQPNFIKPGLLQVSWDTSFNIASFPFELHLKESSIQNLTVRKVGGGLLYFTAYQQFFNKDPLPVVDHFIVNTFFKKNIETVSKIKSGEKIKMIIKVEAIKDAEYVMLTVPIPAGCIFTNKTNNDLRIFKEYQKDKLLLFTETLNKGIHQFEIELEPRYNGSYTLNPAVAALMYFPTFYGRNATRKITLEK